MTGKPITPAPALAAAHLFALVPCAGSGSRAGTAGPKQYEALAGQPLVRHTLAALQAVARLQRILVVVSPGDAALADLRDPFAVADCGGATRAESVGNGLAQLRRLGATDHDWVLVHDAARCLVTAEGVNGLIDACLADASPQAVGGLLAHRLADTLKAASTDGAVVRSQRTLDRADKWLAQTPQMFRLGLLERALREAGPQVTDEASAIEALGLAPLLVEGGAQNFKVTYPDDFALAEAVIRSRNT